MDGLANIAYIAKPCNGWFSEYCLGIGLIFSTCCDKVNNSYAGYRGRGRQADLKGKGEKNTEVG